MPFDSKIMRLVKAMPRRLCKGRMVASTLDANAVASDVQGALTVPVLIQFLELHQRLTKVVLCHDVQDPFSSRWCSSDRCSTRSAYRALFTGQLTVLGAKELWKSRAHNKCYFFVWLVLHGRCWMSDRLFRHGLQTYKDCVLCNQSPKDLDHLILTCSFNREVWFKVLCRCVLQRLSPSPGEAFAAWWITIRKQVPKARRKAVDSLIILVVWRLWLERNARVFSLSSLAPSSLINSIWDECSWWSRAGLLA
jgi:hypothetical protein